MSTRILIVYESRYGYSAAYGKWLAEEWGAAAVESRCLTAELLAGCDTLIAGGGLYAGRIGCAAALRKWEKQLGGKRLFFYTVGLAPVDDPAVFRPVIDKNFSPELLRRIRFFHFRGGMDFQKLGPVHRLMMQMMRKMLLKKKTLTDDDRSLLAAYDTPVDMTDREAIRPLADAVREGRQAD
ncbi:MAG: flavodoxin [Clostridiales bacterium]|jgi:hypothetical protein|nr:flavodoxin [Clostridiales bacterium]